MKRKLKAIPVESAQADDSQVAIGLVSWKNAFVLARIVSRTYERRLQLQRLQPPRRYKGKLYHWRLVLWKCDTTEEKPEWGPQKYGWLPGVRTETEAQVALQRQQAAFQAEAVRWRNLQKPPTKDDRRIEMARLKVLAKPFPVTVRLLRKIESEKRVAEKVGQPAEIDSLQRQAVAVWKVETEKLCGADVLTISNRREFAEVIADAIRRHGKPEDRVNYELALNWKAKGYNYMSTEQYARAVAAVVEKPFTRTFSGLVKQRRRRLGFKTLRRRGPADNLGHF